MRMRRTLTSKSERRSTLPQLSSHIRQQLKGGTTTLQFPRSNTSGYAKPVCDSVLESGHPHPQWQPTRGVLSKEPGTTRPPPSMHALVLRKNQTSVQLPKKPHLFMHHQIRALFKKAHTKRHPFSMHTPVLVQALNTSYLFMHQRYRALFQKLGTKCHPSLQAYPNASGKPK
ncbi:hypothetical protein MRX96_045794 [Rhipicephalus microplus]